MARGSAQATAAANTAAGESGQLFGEGQAGTNFLMPELQAEIANPQGFGEATKARMNTAAQQSAGGSQAGATGQGALLAARTNNPGAAQAAIGAAARGAGENLSKRALDIQTQDALLKERQRQSGLLGMQNLTTLNTGAAVNTAGQIANDVNANTNAANASWDWARFILDPAMAAAGQGAGLAAH